MYLTDKQKWAIERVHFWWNELIRIHGTNPCQTPAVRFNRATCRAGFANSSHNIVSFSSYFLHKEPDYDKTIAHEVAHVYANKFHMANCKHDYRWRRIFASLGFPPDRCHTYEAKHRPSTIILPCPKCQTKVRLGKKVKNGIMAGEVRRTSCCNEKITSTYILETVQEIG